MKLLLKFLVLIGLAILASGCTREKFGETGDKALEQIGIDSGFSIKRIKPGRFDILYNKTLTSKGRVLTVAKEQCPGSGNSAVLVKASTQGDIVQSSFHCTKAGPTPTQQTSSDGGLNSVELKEDAYGRFFVFYDKRQHTYGDAKQKAFFHCQSLGLKARIVRPPVTEGKIKRATFACR